MAKLTGDLALDWKQWRQKLASIGESLGAQGKSASIEVIGSAALMRDGMEGRTSIDLDVWLPNSRIEDLNAFQEAVEQAGLGFDSQGEFDETMPYVQLIKELDTMPEHSPALSEDHGNLNVTYPEMEVIAASKLAAGRDKDIFDLTYMQGAGKINEQTLDAYIEKIPHEFEKNAAKENKIFVDPQIVALSQSQTVETPEERFVTGLDKLREELKQSDNKQDLLTEAVTQTKGFLEKSGEKIGPAKTLELIKGVQTYVMGSSQTDDLKKLFPSPSQDLGQSKSQKL